MKIDRKKFYQMIIDTNGNPSVKDFMECGYMEGEAVERIIRMSQNSHDSEAFVEAAKKILETLES